MNAFFDGYVNSKTSLRQFVEQYDNALKSKMEKENKVDFDSLNSSYKMLTQFIIERQFHESYTNAIFKLFQDELKVRSKGRPPINRKVPIEEKIVKKNQQKKKKKKNEHGAKEIHIKEKIIKKKQQRKKKNALIIFASIIGKEDNTMQDQRDSSLSNMPLNKMAVAAQNTNNKTIRSILLAEKLTVLNFTNSYRNLRIVLRYEKKMKFVEQLAGPPDPETADDDTIDKYYKIVNLEQEVEEGQSVSSYLLKIKSYLDTLELLGYVMPNELSVSLILNSLNKNYDQFVQNYNKHSIGKTIAEVHVMLKLHKKSIPNKAETPAMLAIREGKI
ncbi:zinc finger, CCHC-type containing protein [Tanacetum coccineum]